MVSVEKLNSVSVASRTSRGLKSLGRIIPASSERNMPLLDAEPLLALVALEQNETTGLNINF